MSEQPTDERGIDEILASIDEMLADKTIYSYKPGKKDEISSLLTSASKHSSGRQQPKDVTKPEKATPQKIVLTENNLAESTAPENAEENAADADHASMQTDNDPFDFSLEDLSGLDKGDDAALPADTAAEVSSVDASDSSNDDVSGAEQAESADSEEHTALFDATDELVDDEELDDADEDAADSDADAPAVTAKHRIVLTEAFLEPSAQEALPLWIEQDESSEQGDSAAEVDKAEAGKAELSTEKEVNELPIHVLQPSAEPEEDDDVHEPIERNELVEAIVHDALSTKPEELSSAVKHEMAAIISKYELNELAEIITEEVSAELQKQIQENLPKLIQKSLRQHFELLDKDTE